MSDTVQQIMKRSSKRMVQDGAGEWHQASEVKHSDLKSIESEIDDLKAKLASAEKDAAFTLASAEKDAAFTGRAKMLMQSIVYRTNGASGVVEKAINKDCLRFLHDLDAAHTIDKAREGK